MNLPYLSKRALNVELSKDTKFIFDGKIYTVLYFTSCRAWRTGICCNSICIVSDLDQIKTFCPYSGVSKSQPKKCNLTTENYKIYYKKSIDHMLCLSSNNWAEEISKFRLVKEIIIQ
jgi:hypothetical protein